MIDVGIVVLGVCQCYEVFQVVIDYVFVVYWLMLCFLCFYQVYLYLDVSLVISECGLVGQCGDIDVVILFGDGCFKYGEVYWLFCEEVFLVCSLWLVEGLQLLLVKVYLVCLLMLYLKLVQYVCWFDWLVLFEVLVIDWQLILVVFSFDNYILLIQVVIVGQGVVIGWCYLVDGLFEQGLFCWFIGESCLL